MNGDHRSSSGPSDGADTFEHWFREYHDRVLAQCVRMLRDRAAAEDIAQETLLRAWTGRERMREQDLGAWLSVVARNLCISHIRRQRRVVPMEALPETPDESTDPAVVAQRNESRRAVRRAMGQVGERHRKVLFLRDMHGVDYEDLGAELSLSPEGTRSVLFRARRVLRDRLAAVGEGLAAALAGTKVRFRSAVTQGRNAVRNAEASVTPAATAAFNMVLAVGITFASVGGGSILGLSPANADASEATFAAQNRMQSQPLQPTGVAAVGVRQDASDSSVRPPQLIRPPAVSKPNANGHVFDPGNGSSDLTIDVAGQHIRYEGWRQPGTDYPLIYTGEDMVFEPLCNVSPQACAELSKPR